MNTPERQKKIRRIKRKYERDWLSIKGVMGVGVGTVHDGRIGIIISVVSMKPEITEHFPREIEGVPVEIKKTGDFKAF
ncbi:MAG: hypothetical protein ACE5GL_11975 [Calditrichia bacterium]